MKVFAAVLLLAACSLSQSKPSHHSLLVNLNEKLSHESLVDSVAFGLPIKKHVPIISRAELLLNYWAADSQYEKDHICNRLAHAPPISTIVYRQEDSPSTHVVSLKLPDGSLRADIHLDGNGPQKLFSDPDEFFFHKLAFQDNNQERMNANLKQSFIREANVPQVLVSSRERTLLYNHETPGLEKQQVLVNAGVAPAQSINGLAEERDLAQKQYDPALDRAGLVREIAEMARSEQLAEQELHETHPLPSESASVSALPAMERFDGSGQLKPHDFEKVGKAFEKEFHKRLPVSANGETAVHRAMGFDHRNRIDVALVPDSAEGLWLRHYLEDSKIPFYAFRSAIAGKATGAHIHIGPSSTKLASTVSGQSSVGF